MRGPSNIVVGIALLAVAIAGGFALIDDTAPEPEVREAQSRAAIERAVRDGQVLAGPPRAPFRLRYPDTWVPLSEERLGDADTAPLGGLRRRDNSAALTVSVQDPVEGGLDELRRELPARLEERFPDFRLVAIRRVEVPAGPALLTSFIRERSGQAQTMLVVPDGDRSFQVDVAIRGEARDAAAEAGVILGTFDIADG